MRGGKRSVHSKFEMILHDSNSFRKGREAEPTYDIFKRRDNDYPFWITAAATLEEARKRIAGYALIVAGEYFIYSQGEGTILECVTPEKEELRTTRPIWLWPHSWNHAQHRKVA
jgi:hypothetical protein